MNKQSQDRNQSKRAARLFKKHEASYRAFINLLIRQVERELRELDAQQQADGNELPSEERKDGA